LMRHDSHVGSFEQGNGHQTYKLTDDLRAPCACARFLANRRRLRPMISVPLRVAAKPGAGIVATNGYLWITTDDLGTLR
jgi:hypothetical protein